MANESGMTFSRRGDKERDRKSSESYDEEIDRAMSARRNQRLDTDPKIEKEGFLGMDNLDKLRRRKIKKIF